jgi:hypothetical protein
MSLLWELAKLLAGPEGQYLERKSLFDGPPGKKKACHYLGGSQSEIGGS